MKNKFLLLSLIISLNTFAQNQSAFDVGEWFKFRIHYGMITAGYATLEVKEGVKENKAEAIVWYTVAAEQDDMDGQLNLGLAYANGQGVEQNYTKAFYWFEKAAQHHGCAYAHNNLGVCYLNGDGTLKDSYKAFYWFEKAAKYVPEAKYLLGVLYFRGEGCVMDKKQAAYWIEAAYKNDYEGAKKFWDENELWRYK